MVVSLLAEVITLISGLIIPRMIIEFYGSASNGLIVSITQIISFVTLLRAGVGAVTRASLYKPLADNDISRISIIINSTQVFMRKIAMFFSFIVSIAACVYPFYVPDFTWAYTASLFVIISLTTFIQYYFGISYQLLLMADQKMYIYTAVNIISIIFNIMSTIFFISRGYSLHIVKMASVIILSLTPIVTYFYVRQHYKINLALTSTKEVLEQKWDALGHQIAYYIFTSTDIAILTFMSSVANVSVYAVYHLPIKAVKLLVKTYSSSVEAAFGSLIAENKRETLQKSHEYFECFMYTTSVVIFSCLGGIIVPFVNLYTIGISDANYNQPLFAVLMLLGEMTYCLRIPYMMLVEASGHYKQTKKGAYAEAFLNVVPSILLSLFIDPLIAVSIGTIVALLVRTIEISRYSDFNIIQRKRKRFYSNLFSSYVILLICTYISQYLNIFFQCRNYYEWLVFTIMIFLVSVIVTLIYILICYKQIFYEMMGCIRSIFKSKRG